MNSHFLDPAKYRAPEGRGGFSLVEIMVAMFVLVILGSFTTLSVMNILPMMRIDRASSRLAFQLQQARSEAIANNQTIFVSLDPTRNELEIWVDRNRNGQRENDELTRVLLEQPGRVSLKSDWATGAFNAYGQFITTPGQREMRTVHTVLAAPGSTKSIELTLRGSGAITKR